MFRFPFQAQSPPSSSNVGSNPPPTVVSPAPTPAYSNNNKASPSSNNPRPPSSVGVAPFTPSSVQYGPPPGNANLSASRVIWYTREPSELGP